MIGSFELDGNPQTGVLGIVAVFGDGGKGPPRGKMDNPVRLQEPADRNARLTGNVSPC
jgi:hypothetical protein